MLAINILERDFLRLLEPLDYNQGAPYGFLFAVKSAVLLFGNNEWALRLVALLCGILSVILFFKLSQLILKPVAAFFAIFLFAFMGSLVFYSAETKQYSTDVMMATATLLLLTTVERNGWTWSRAVALALFGSVGIWISHPLIFVLAGIGLVTLSFSLKNRNYKEAKFILFCGVLWLANFSLFYAASLQSTVGNAVLINSWEGQGIFMPLDFRMPQWLAQTFFYRLFLHAPLFTLLYPVTATLWFVGMHQIWRLRRKDFWLFAGVILLVLVASSIRKYPFKGRFILFLSPILILAIASGIAVISSIPRRAPRVIASVLAGAVMATTVYGAFNSDILCRKRGFDKMIQYIAANSLEGDFICPNTNRWLMKYYVDRNEWPKWSRKPSEELGYVIPKETTFSDILNQIKTKAPSQSDRRLWIVIGSHKGNEIAKDLVDKFDEVAERMEYWRHDGARLYLFNIGNFEESQNISNAT